MYHKPIRWSLTALKNSYEKQGECSLDLNHAQKLTHTNLGLLPYVHKLFKWVTVKIG